jgi:hypothetical protein
MLSGFTLLHKREFQLLGFPARFRVKTHWCPALLFVWSFAVQWKRLRLLSLPAVMRSATTTVADFSLRLRVTLSGTRRDLLE